MKRKRMSVFVVVCFIVFIGVIDYPFLAQLYNEQVQGCVASSYENASDALDEDVRKLEYQKAVEYNQWLFSGNVSFGDAFGDKKQSTDEYEQLLCVGKSEEIAVIEIPKIHVRLPVYHGTSEQVLQKGAGHLNGSSLPVGGENTHTCILAHRGLPRKEMFTNLDSLEEGDLFFLHVLGQTLAYEVYETETVLPDQTEGLKIQEGKDIATLITCTPYGINTHRLYVHGERVTYQKETEEDNSINLKEIIEKYGWMVLTAGLLGWMMLLLFQMNHQKPEKRGGKVMEKSKKKWKKPVCVILACAGCLGIPHMNADAGAGMIQITLEDLQDDSSKRSNIPVCLYRVGTLDETGNPVFDSGYNISIFPEDGESMNQMSKDIVGNLKEDMESSAKTDDSGTVRFEGLDDGIYLIVLPDDNEYGEVNPFLITLPYYQEIDGRIEGPMYEVTAIPKASPHQEGEEEKNVVKTGDTSQAEGYLIAGAGAVLTAAIIKAKKES